MAALQTDQQPTPLFLKSFHRIGRLPFSVETLVEYPEVSRIHCIIEWQNNAWYIRDVSKNGVWVNHKRLPTNKDIKLNLHDSICIANVPNLTFNVICLNAPKDLLISTEVYPLSYGEVEVIELEKYHFLPDESEPELVIFYDAVNHEWCYESQDASDYLVVKDDEQITFAQSSWKLFRANVHDQQQTAVKDDSDVRDLAFLFSLSQDEEQTELQIKQANNLLNLDIRTHHYLTALLARYRLQDMEQAYDEHVQGWVSIKQLAQDLGLSESYINIQIHRARKQFVEHLKHAPLAQHIIERKRGKVRFGSPNFRIYKGQTIEASTIPLEVN